MKGRELINTQRMRRQSRTKGTPRVASLALRHNFGETRVPTGGPVEPGKMEKMENRQTYIYVKSDPFQSILSPRVPARGALSNHNKAMIPLFNRPVNHSNRPRAPGPGSGLCSAAPPAGVSSSARLHSFAKLNSSPTGNYHQKK